MGTDIHLAVERRDRDGRWHLVPNPTRPCPGYLHERSTAEQPCYFCKGTGKRVEEFFHDRNYDVFSILADVRNGRGFAGVVTGSGFDPISAPRGFPLDLSPELCAAAKFSQGEEQAPDEYDGPWFGDHSFSFLTVAEILRGAPRQKRDEHYWLRTTEHQGVVGPAQYAVWKAEGRPRSWSGGVSGGGVRHVSPAQMDDLIAKGTVSTDQGEGPFGDGGRSTDGFSYYTTVTWKETYAEAAAPFLAVVFTDLINLGDPSDVRVVFGFDS